MKRFIPILVGLCIVLAFGVGWLGHMVVSSGKGTSPKASATPTPKPTVTLNQIKDLFSKDVIKFGDANRKVLFVEVSDPSCPYCQVAAGLNPTLNAQIGSQFKLVKDGGTYVAPVVEMKKLVDAGKASLVYIYSPGHGNGEMGAKALYCAYEMGKFWEAENKLMTSAGYDLLNTTIKNDKAQSQKLADFLKSAVDPASMKACLDSGKYDARLGSDAALATSIGISGTPGFYINNQLFAGAYSFKDMQSVVDAALK